jgi:uncharacterized membrane-anchored protein YjiN (DUF445 family)
VIKLYTMIESLFGSKTRVKLLQLFLRNPDSSFYVREITRLIDEQINSVRRELANLVKVEIIQSQNVDNKLYYQVNSKYQHYKALRQLFAEGLADEESSTQVEDKVTESPVVDSRISAYKKTFKAVDSLRCVVLSGKLVSNSSSPVDLLLAGTIPKQKLTKLVKAIEKVEGIDINYTLLSFEEFYYRLNIKDKFISDIFKEEYVVIEDKDSVLSGK